MIILTDVEKVLINSMNNNKKFKNKTPPNLFEIVAHYPLNKQ